MSKADGWENALLLLVFNNDDYLLLGDAGGILGSVSPGSIYASLHTAIPDEAGTQLTSETAYTGYNRIAVARTTGGFTVTNNSVSPASNIDFDECTAAPGGDITYFGYGVSSTGAGKLLYYGTMTPNIVMQVGGIPRIKTTSTVTES